MTTSSGVLALKQEDGSWKARFEIDLELLEELPEGTFLEATFESPVGHDKPLITAMTLEANTEELNLESPLTTDLECKNYRVDVRLFEDSTRSVELGLHIQWVNANIVANLVNPNISRC